VERRLELIKIETSESTLDDLKVRNVVQEVRCPRRIWVTVLRPRRVSVGPIVVSGAVVCMGAISLSLDRNHILNTLGTCVAAFKRRHF
jgi:hypothetical protein